MTIKHGTLYYLASPYSHADATVRQARASLAEKAAVDLLHFGIYVFAPIPYNHPWEKYNVPGHWDFWADFDKTFVSRCDGVIILTLDGWDRSKGVTAELDFAKENNIPVYYLSLEQIAKGDIDHIPLSRQDNKAALV